MHGAGADLIWWESVPGPRTSRAGAVKKSGGSATLLPARDYIMVDDSISLEVLPWEGSTCSTCPSSS